MEMREFNITGYFTAEEVQRIKKCMQYKNMFKISQFVREAVLRHVESIEDRRDRNE